MFESQTFETIISRMLDRIPNTFDKREGSIIWDALAPSAIEMSKLYETIDYFIEQQNPLTADREHLILICETFGITPLPATPAVFEAELVMKEEGNTVPIGSRFSWRTYTFKVTEQTGDTTYIIECEQTGKGTNEANGIILPIYNIVGLRSARIIRLLIPGEDEESTEDLRSRLIDYLQHPSYGGNENQYINDWVKPIAGVGGVKVIRTPDGKKARVDVIITDSEWNKPSAELIERVQNTLCPLGITGLPEIELSGTGITPIAHEVLVKPVEEYIVDVDLNLTLQDGFSFEMVEYEIKENITKMFKEKISEWDSRDNLLPYQTTKSTYITLSSIDINYILHDIKGIIYYENTLLNDNPVSVELAFNEIPVLGEVRNVI